MTVLTARSPRCAVVVLTLGLLASLLSPAQARAQDPRTCVDELDDEQVVQRTRAITREFREHERHTRAFRFGWAGLFFAFAVTEFAVIGPRTHGAQRWNAYISAVGATSAFLQMVALPMPGVWARRRIERMPDDTPEQRRAQLRYALHTLELAANADRIIHGAFSHATAVAWGIGWGTLLTVKFDSWFVSAQSYLAGAFINEARIFTAPAWATNAWTRTRGGFCWGRYVDDSQETYWHEPELEARLTPTLGGLSLSLTF